MELFWVVLLNAAIAGAWGGIYRPLSFLETARGDFGSIYGGFSYVQFQETITETATIVQCLEGLAYLLGRLLGNDSPHSSLILLSCLLPSVTGVSLRTFDVLPAIICSIGQLPPSYAIRIGLGTVGERAPLLYLFGNNIKTA